MKQGLATVAQLVEQGIRNAQVCGSIPHGGSMLIIWGSLAVQREPFLIFKKIAFSPYLDYVQPSVWCLVFSVSFDTFRSMSVS